MKQSVFCMGYKLSLLLLGLVMLSSCVEDTDQVEGLYRDIENLRYQADQLGLGPMGVYEGGWNDLGLSLTPDKPQVEVKGDTLKFVLPEIEHARHLVEAMLDADDGDFYNEALSILRVDYWQTSETVQRVGFSLQGISNNAMYNGISRPATLSYEIYAGQITCRIEILVEDCTLVYDLSTKLFTLRMLYKECTFTDLVSGWQGRWQSEDGEEFIFVATKKIR